MGFQESGGCAVHSQGKDASEDIVIRIDADGFIIHASSNACRLGIDFCSLLLMPHVADLAAPQFAADVSRYCSAVLAFEKRDDWIEFARPAQEHDDAEGGEESEPELHWYALNLRPVGRDTSDMGGAIGILRSVQKKHDTVRAIGREITRETATPAGRDPVTGLANRHALCASLNRSIAGARAHDKSAAAVAIFAIDRMRAIFMQYGQSTADEIRWGFARYLGTMTSPPHELAQLDDERFGVLLRGLSQREARAWANDVLKTFAGLTMASPGRAPELTASAGIARAERSVDLTMRQAELGLVMARAGGGMQTGICRTSSPVISGDAMERAMEEAVQRAVEQSGQSTRAAVSASALQKRA
ncbi:diguanylate cyclase domain-containing protein [Erythrobacter sp. NAP1]|uniref:GGDEF domain-containing protein n=1 Tax=Erythrobacter sp. NAP1 TaxID=237727 RepID=UPI001F5179C8|nr:diguanylate cyclase [Erythrobacter sp. NAP1]